MSPTVWWRRTGRFTQTKGTPINAVDNRQVSREGIYGSVCLVIPHLGNLVLFLKSSLGMLVMIVALMLLVEMPHWHRREIANS